MASLVLGSPLIYANAPRENMQKRRCTTGLITCSAVSETGSKEPVVVRRSANYRPSHWDHHHVLSLRNKYAEEGEIQERAKLLKENVRKLLDEAEGPLNQLELIDSLQRLGVSYHFDSEISGILTEIYETRRNRSEKSRHSEDLHTIALEFRLLRQHGFTVSQDCFDVIKSLWGDVELEGSSEEDIKGLLSLYEASYLSMKSDSKLKEIRSYAKARLSEYVNESEKNDRNESYLREMVIRTLEMPYHWRARTLEARWYIDVYEKKHDMNTLLLDFAKHDFNIVQAFHQHDLKYVFSWWSKTGLKQLDFARDRILENYIWSAELFHEPQFGYHRREVTKIFALLTIIDDLYDVYGTHDELVCFTEAIKKWDMSLVEELPEYMRSCFLVLYKEINQIGRDILGDKKFDVIPYLRKAWTDITDTYLTEAKWHMSGYIPCFEEYMENAWISIGAETVLLHSFSVLSDTLTKETFDSLSEHRQPIIRCSSFILRIANDLVTSSEEMARGDVQKSIQCYMHETGATETEAREHMMRVISDAWDEMNYEKTTRSSLYHRRFLDAVIDLARMAQCIYHYGDGLGCPEKAKTIDHIQSMLINPIPLD
ncbi:PREDICTED: tricyclene synthase, chloroplastic-like [Tarenaya hassleriana]|uniref:tricyclene synthase, chloroplastic-like n=1 Tax=Tarenaya hassleriana TaxID=28532 RepID=UPI00053C0CF5|nr:PREDICTED: tricyclene synthase, chloroplastic-like [Tarenaya hassleriana]